MPQGRGDASRLASRIRLPWRAGVVRSGGLGPTTIHARLESRQRWCGCPAGLLGRARLLKPPAGPCYSETFDPSAVSSRISNRIVSRSPSIQVVAGAPRPATVPGLTSQVKAAPDVGLLADFGFVTMAAADQIIVAGVRHAVADLAIRN